MRMGHWRTPMRPAVAAIAVLALSPTWAQAPAPPAATSSPAAAPDAAKSAFEALSDADRRATQEALIWTGDYKSVVDGGYGAGTRAAIIAYAKRKGLPADGTLSDKDRRALIVSMAALKSAVGFAPTTDARSGIAFALPLKLLPKRVDTRAGSRWSSADGAMSVETMTMNPTDGDLQAQFDKLKDSTAARKVTYKILRDDFLVVSGEAGPNAFYTRMARDGLNGSTGLRGYSLIYPSSAQNLGAISVAIANAFTPFPAARATPAPGIAASAPPGAPAPPSRVMVVAASALVVGPNQAISSLSACAEPRIGGHVARVVKTDAKSALVLYEAPGLAGAALKTPAGVAEPGLAALVLFEAPSNGTATAPAAELVVASGAIVASPTGGAPRVRAPLGASGVGAAVFDRNGSFLGLIGTRVAPQGAWPLIPASALALLLPSQTATDTPSAEKASAAADIVANARGAIAALTCVQ